MDRKRKTADGFEVRTDLALEERESFKGDGGEVSGVALREWERDRSQARFTEVKIINEQGARAMGKPVGTYLALEADQLIMDTLGEHVSSYYIQGKRAEWREYKTRVSSWEREKYIMNY